MRCAVRSEKMGEVVMDCENCKYAETDCIEYLGTAQKQYFVECRIGCDPDGEVCCGHCEYWNDELEECGAFECNGIDCPELPCEKERNDE